MRLGILDYAPIDEGGTPEEALQASTRLAQRAEELDYTRFWVAEHHGMPSMTSVSPEVLMSHLAASTSTLRIGSGGVMLPHYASVKVAENYMTMSALNPGRIDLGFGRAPGADPRIHAALNDEKAGQLPYADKVADLLGFLTGEHAEDSRYAGVAVTPRASQLPTPYVLGASGSTAQLAGERGLGFTFAHFINPSLRGARAAQLYREQFTPGVFLSEPEVLVAVFVTVGRDEEEAAALDDAFHLWLANVESGRPPATLPSMETAREHEWSRQELEARERNQGRVLSGTAPRVAQALRELAESYGADEVLVNPMMPTQEHRVRALESLAAELSLSEG